MSSRDDLARLIKTEIALSGQRQWEVAYATGITEKHLSEIVNAKVGANLDTVDAILTECGRRLALATVPDIEVPAAPVPP